MRIVSLAEIPLHVALADAAAVLHKGGLAAFPTETFYGIGARYDRPEALERIYRQKKRPFKKAIPLIIGRLDEIGLLSKPLPLFTENLLKGFWPGPLTVLLPAKPGIPDLITAGTGKVAVRIPGDSFALSLAKALEVPLTATSANISGSPPANSAGEVEHYFNEGIDLLIDGGKTPGGKPSTIIEIRDSQILVHRDGAVPQEEIMSRWNLIYSAGS